VSERLKLRGEFTYTKAVDATTAASNCSVAPSASPA